MLKSEMEEKILSLELKLEEEEKTQAFTSARLNVMLGRVDEYDRLIVIKDNALCAIDGILAVNCRDIAEWHRHGNASLSYASDLGEDAPVCPPITELYSSLRHIEGILNRPVEEPKKDTRFGY